MANQSVINEFLKWCYTDSKAPNNFWNTNNCKIILKYLYRTYVITETDLKDKGLISRLLELQFIMLAEKVKESTEEYLEFMTNGNVKMWELANIPRTYWDNEDNIKKYCEWFIQSNGWTNEDAVKKLKYNLLHPSLTHKLPYATIIKIGFPDCCLYDFNLGPRIWKDEEFVKGYVKYIVGVKHKLLSSEDISNNIATSMFKSNLVKRYGLFNLIELAYPGQFHKYDIVQPDIDNRSEVKVFLLWYVYEKLQLTDSYLLDNLNYTMIPKFIRKKYTVKDCIDLIYGGKYRIWDFSKCKLRNWSELEAIEYLLWLNMRKDITIEDIYKDRSILDRTYSPFCPEVKRLIHCCADNMIDMYIKGLIDTNMKSM